MTISQPNSEVQPTGEEPAEYIETPDPELDEEPAEHDIDGTARPSGSPPATGRRRSA